MPVKTPLPAPVSELLKDETTKVVVVPNGNGNGTWKTLAATIGGSAIAIGLIYAIGQHMAEDQMYKRTVDQLVIDIKDMDKHGTAYTRWQMDEDLKFHQDVEKRLRELEKK